MFKIRYDNGIELIQGDTGIIELKLEDYNLKEGDKVYFSVKKDYAGEYLIFIEQTEFNNGKAKIILTAEDTNIATGTYLYDIQCNLADGRVDTVILPTQFRVLGGITNV